MMDVSIIIVNYNTKELLKQTIESVINNTKGLEYEIIVVDNASVDGSIELIKNEFKDVLLIENKNNLGFSKANNIGIKKSNGKYVLLLNSDTVVLDKTIKICFDYMEENIDIGALGCKVVLNDGRLDHACKRGFPTPSASLYYMLKLNKFFPKSKKFGQYTMSYVGEDEISEVDSLMGAFMMVRKDVIDKIGLLDEDFFMYGEDIDWCFRIKEAGYKVVYFPKAKIIHYKGASSRKKKYKTLYEFHRAMYLFYNKHYLKKYNILIALFVYLGIAIRFLICLAVNLFRR